MANRVSRSISLLQLGILILVSAPSLAGADDPYSWDDCRARVDAIRNGTIDNWNGVTPSNIGKYIYHGPVRGLDESYPRDQYLLLTYEGTVTFISIFTHILKQSD